LAASADYKLESAIKTDGAPYGSAAAFRIFDPDIIFPKFIPVIIKLESRLSLTTLK